MGVLSFRPELPVVEAAAEAAHCPYCDSCRCRTTHALQRWRRSQDNITALAWHQYTHVYVAEGWEGQLEPNMVRVPRNWCHAANVAMMWVWVRNYGQRYF